MHHPVHAGAVPADPLVLLYCTVLYCTVLYCTVQGLFQLTHWFYLPAALFIPPAQFLVHSQFVFLFQFWIHSELVGDLGPLGLVFNTSTFHQVQWQQIRNKPIFIMTLA